MNLRYGSVVAVLVLLIAAVAGCADPDNPPGTEPPDLPFTDPDGDLRATCGAVAFDAIPADWSAFPPIGDIEGELDLTSVGEERAFFDDYDWYVAEQTSDQLTLFGVADDDLATLDLGYGDAAFQRDGDRWVPLGWGQCRVEVTRDGWGNARFVLDPEVEPDPAATTISILAWEMGCASGQPPGDRQVDAVIATADDRSVSMVILVEPVVGGADCPSNPSFLLDIDLGEPLGNRTILDASVTPAHERPWPPTQSSLESNGLEE